MKIHIYAIGHKMSSWIKESYQEYAKRMPPEWRINLHEIKPEYRSVSKNADAAMQIEAQRLIQAIPTQAHIIVLDEQGKDLTTHQFASQLECLQTETRDLAFVIGGADGIDPTFKQHASMQIRLSSLTLPHGLVRVILVEQLYRATTILKNHPYHRE